MADKTTILNHIKNAARILGIIVIGLLAMTAALLGTCTMIVGAVSPPSRENLSTAIFGLVLEFFAVLMAWAVYLMYKNLK